MLNRQLAFNQAVTKLRAQAKYSVGDLYHRSCRYFSPDGSRCAVGWLLLDSAESKQDLELNTASNPLVLAQIDPKYYEDEITQDDSDFLVRMQVRLHDTHALRRNPEWDADRFEGAVREFAGRWKLEIPSCNQSTS